MRFDRMYEVSATLPVRFERLDIEEAHVRDEFMSKSEQEVVLALVAAASQAVRWVGLDRDGLIDWMERARLSRALAIVRNRFLVILTLGLIPRFWKGTGSLVDVLFEDTGVTVNRAVIALRQRDCVAVYRDIVTPTPALVERLARACARTTEGT